ncbi:hypothetical protein P3X46_018843 [Hevea brasiliensis]|uniref:AB hydrolase-1 domain-containing protein n=1 Tax=Hevea brasiliensis TaxID=3981 RepID=A0ABQ9LT76_HEVBR|nr:salicylic acid-binding protein 2 [Hevea brasiliensis]KAJ9170763.1 hypothetical protein P3X46_018843 [Hevea brasiliensis]
MTRFNQQKHFVLVHGACHGAWSWYKLKPLLKAAGHQVSALDLAASGIDMKSIQHVHTLYEYTHPLLELLASLPPNERVILVGHSLGGLNLALAMEKFPQKISVAVYLSAFMPDTLHQPSYVLDQYNKRTPNEAWLDTQFLPYSTSLQHMSSMFFGPKFISSKLYQLSPIEDLELAMTLVRPSSLFLHDLSQAKKFSSEGYGSVSRVYIICEEDKAIPEEFQQWMIANSPVEQVIKIEGSDHMTMFSKPQELCQCLCEIAQKYA